MSKTPWEVGELLAQRVEVEAIRATRAAHSHSLHQIAADLRDLLAATAPTPDEVGLVEGERPDLMRCEKSLAGEEHPRHWHAVMAGNITVAGGYCAGVKP